MKMPSLPLIVLALAGLSAASLSAAPLRVLLIDGQNNHDWKSSSPWLRRVLEQSGLFQVDVATTPPAGGDLSGFKPDFARYQAVVSNYNGDPWSPATREAFVKYVRGGGGFVSVHAADNAFPDWPEYNEMIGVGGWNGRTERAGPWLYWDGRVIRDVSPGTGGHHGRQHAFKVITREPAHPITAGLPAEWMHAKDELYDQLRGPARRVTVLATAFSDKSTGGTGRHEPVLLAIAYGEGRVFHTALGHNNGPDLTSQHCAGFIVTLQRGTEWAATGQVTQKVPADFPTSDRVSSRE